MLRRQVQWLSSWTVQNALSFYVCTADQIIRVIKPRGTRCIGHANLPTADEPLLISCTSWILPRGPAVCFISEAYSKKTNPLRPRVSNPWPARVHYAARNNICKQRIYHTNYIIIKAVEYTAYYFVTCGPRNSPFAEEKVWGPMF